MTVKRYNAGCAYAGEEEMIQVDDGAYVSHEDYAELLKERDALAVENASLKKCCDAYDADGLAQYGDQWEVTPLETPATDAAIANIQAHIWLEAKDLTKSIIETDSVDHVDFLFDGKIEQLRKESTHD